MKNHIFGFIFIGLVFLSSCTPKQDEITVVDGERSPFYIDVYSLDSASVQTEVEKTGRISARSTLTLSAK